MIDDNTMQAVLDFVNSKTRVESCVLLEYSEALLLTPAADECLAALREHNAGNANVNALLDDREYLIEHARREGTASVRAELLTPDYQRALEDEARSGTMNAIRRDDVHWALDTLAVPFESIDLEARYVLLRKLRWARNEAEAGTRLFNSGDGDVAANIERAIEHFKNAQEIFTPQSYPLDYGVLEISCSAACMKREYGEKAQNIASAIQHLERAVAVLPRTRHPKNWALANVNLGTAYWLRESEARLEDVVLAIAHASMALQESVWLDAPIVEGVRAKIEMWQSILRNEELRTDAIEEHIRLGDVQYEQARGVLGASLDLAIAHYRAAMDLTTEADSHHRRFLHSAIGVVLFENSTGNRSDNIERAIARQRAVLEICSRDVCDQDWATAHFNLGNAFANRIEGPRAQNIDNAIAHYRESLEVFTREALPSDWARVRNSLGYARMHQVGGERATNLESARRDFLDAAEVYTREAFPDDWAMTQHNLAAVYMQRIEGHRRDNVAQAIRLYEDSLKVRTRERMPYYWAMTKTNLAAACVEFEKPDDALRHVRSALKVYTRDKHPGDWAFAMFTLGNAQSNSGAPDSSIESFQQALTVYTRDAHPERWAGLQNNLGLAYRRLARRGDTAAVTKEREHLLFALEVFQEDQHPVQYRQALANLAATYVRSAQWETALETYDRAIAAGRRALAETYTEVGRLEQAGSTHRLFVLSALCLYKLGRAGASLERLEAGQAQVLAERISLRDADLSRLSPDLARSLGAARRKVRDLEAKMRSAPTGVPPATEPVDFSKLDEVFESAEKTVDLPDAKVFSVSLDDFQAALAPIGLVPRFRSMLEEARAELVPLIDAARMEAPELFAAEFGSADICRTVPDGGALVTFMITDEGSVAWVLPSGVDEVSLEHAVELPADTAQTVGDLMISPSGTGGYLDAYFERLEGGPLASWQTAIEEVSGRLWRVFMEPVKQRLDQLGIAPEASVLLMLPGQLRLLPIHAASRIVDGLPQPFLADYSVIHAASVQTHALSIGRLNESTPRKDGLLAVINPTGDLPYTSVESDRVSVPFADAKKTVLPNDEATEDAIVGALEDYGYLHFACHGEYDWTDVMRSSLTLANGTRLTLAKVLSPAVDLARSRLVFLSACETGIVEFERAASENVGLHTGFQLGGAPGVISTLWRIDDVSTALLAGEFYRRHVAEGQEPAAALRAAQAWLAGASAEELGLAAIWETIYRSAAAPDRDPNAYRQMRYHREHPQAVPFAAPYFWAGFVLTGT